MQQEKDLPEILKYCLMHTYSMYLHFLLTFSQFLDELALHSIQHTYCNINTPHMCTYPCTVVQPSYYYCATTVTHSAPYSAVISSVSHCP